MTRSTYLAVLAALSVPMFGIGQARAAEDPVGYWATEKNESQVRITHCGGEKICGSIFWMKEPTDAKGNPRLDRENEDDAKRKRPILGLTFIVMKPDDENWKGTVYNAQNGKTYDATLKMLSSNQLELKGCVAYILCGGQKWTREEAKTVGTADSVRQTAAHKSGSASVTPSE